VLSLSRDTQDSVMPNPREPSRQFDFLMGFGQPQPWWQIGLCCGVM